MKRCRWCTSELLIAYHDNEWGKRLRFDDLYLFETLVLESMQAGLSWETILKKRENYRLLFDGFDYEKIAQYSSEKLGVLYNDARIIRSKRKIDAIVNNARQFICVKAEFGSFYQYLISFTKGEILIETSDEVVSENELSQQISFDLKKRGFKFVGPVIIYAYLQAIGIIVNHDKECELYMHG